MICAWIETSSADTGSSATISCGSHAERPRDADALALPAGELVREAVVVLGREPHPLEQALHGAAQLGAGLDAVQAHRVADDLHDALARVERRVRVLEDHLHLAAQRPQRAPRQAA